MLSLVALLLSLLGQAACPSTTPGDSDSGGADPGYVEPDSHVPDSGPEDTWVESDEGPWCPAEPDYPLEAAWHGGGAGVVAAPGAVLLTADKLLLVGDEDPSAAPLHVFDAAGEDPAVPGDELAHLTDLGAGEGLDLAGVTGLALNRTSGAVLAVDQGAQRVAVLTPTAAPPYLELSGSIGGEAADPDAPLPGEFVHPRDVAVDSLGRVYVSDDGDMRRDVQVFDAAGTPLASFGAAPPARRGEEGNLDQPGALTLDEARNRVYVCDEGTGELAVFRYHDGSFETRVAGFHGTPKGVAVDQYGTIYVADQVEGGQSALVLLEPETFQEVSRTVGAEDGPFTVPGPVAADVGQDALLVADEERQAGHGFSLSRFQARACLRTLKVTGSPRAVASTAVTLRVELLGPDGRWDWARFRELAELTVTAADGQPVAGAPAELTLHNGVGSVTVTLGDAGPSPLTFTVVVDGLTASHEVEVLDDPAQRTLSGTLSGADLTWASDDVVHLTGDVTVPAGSTLRIEAGAIVLVDEAVRIDVEGDVEALGEADLPIVIQSSHPDTRWGQIDHLASGDVAVYRHVFFVHGGNGPWQPADQLVYRHCCPYVLQTRDRTLELRRVLVVDSDGKGLLTWNTFGLIEHSLFERLGMGAELMHGDVTIRDSVFAELRGPDDNDGLYLSSLMDAGAFELRRVIVADGDDDGIDIQAANAVISDVAVYGWADKGMSFSGREPVVDNCLIADNRIGVKMDDPPNPLPEYPHTTGEFPHHHRFTGCTVVDNTNEGFVITSRGGADKNAEIYLTLRESVVWGNQVAVRTDFDPVNVEVESCVLPELPDGVVAQDNLFDAPVFLDVEPYDQRLHPLSPGWSSGTGGAPVGWRGF